MKIARYKFAHTKNIITFPRPPKKNLYQLNMNELPLWQLAKFIWPIQEETDTKNATLCVREKIKMGKVEYNWA